MTLLRNLSLLALAVIGALAVFGPVAWMQRGVAGIAAASVAAGVCGFSAAASLILLERLRRSGRVVHGVLLGMIFRLGIPLAVGIAVTRQGGPLRDAGIFGWIVVFYLITLVVETCLSVRILASKQQSARSV